MAGSVVCPVLFVYSGHLVAALGLALDVGPSVPLAVDVAALDRALAVMASPLPWLCLALALVPLARRRSWAARGGQQQRQLRKLRRRTRPTS